MDVRELIRVAQGYRSRSYAPVSRFHVGAALLTRSGNIYGGCNIENVAFSPSICAERTAFCKAISEGEREFKAIVIAGGPDIELYPQKECPPCGVCRQVMSEFCDEDFLIILVRGESDQITYTLGELFPNRFSEKFL